MHKRLLVMMAPGVVNIYDKRQKIQHCLSFTTFLNYRLLMRPMSIF